MVNTNIRYDISLGQNKFWYQESEVLQESIHQKDWVKFLISHSYFLRCPIFDCEYNYSRKENKIDVKIIQTPLQEGYYKEFTENRLQLEAINKIENESIKILTKLFEDNTDLHEKYQYVNRRTESCKIFSGILNIVASETNEIEFKEEPHLEKIEKKRENKLTITCKTRLRKTIQKKCKQLWI